MTINTTFGRWPCEALVSALRKTRFTQPPLGIHGVFRVAKQLLRTPSLVCSNRPFCTSVPADSGCHYTCSRASLGSVLSPLHAASLRHTTLRQASCQEGISAGGRDSQPVTRSACRVRVASSRPPPVGPPNWSALPRLHPDGVSRGCELDSARLSDSLGPFGISAVLAMQMVTHRRSRPFAVHTLRD